MSRELSPTGGRRSQRHENSEKDWMGHCCFKWRQPREKEYRESLCRGRPSVNNMEIRALDLEL